MPLFDVLVNANASTVAQQGICRIALRRRQALSRLDDFAQCRPRNDGVHSREELVSPRGLAILLVARLVDSAFTNLVVVRLWLRFDLLIHHSPKAMLIKVHRDRARSVT